MDELRNRHLKPDPDWLFPVVPPVGCGVIIPSCTERSDLLVVPARVGVGLRLGGEANICFHCGPEGGVYHPGHCAIAEGATDDADYTMSNIRDLAQRLPFTLGYDPEDLTAKVMAAYDAEMRRAFGIK